MEHQPNAGSAQEPEPVQGAEMPAWFVRKRSKAQAGRSIPQTRRSSSQGRQSAKPESSVSASPRRVRTQQRHGAPASPIPAAMVQKHWSQRLREWIVSFSATGYAVSFFLHLAVLLLLSIVVVNNLTQSGSLIAVSFDENGAETEFEEILDTRLDATEEVAPETPEFTAVPLEPIENAEPAFPEVSDTPSPSLQGMLEDSKAKKSSPSPAIQIPQGGNAVTRGSFTAWTVPDDPEPGENYLIVVQIQVPGHLEKYPLRDLKGMVIGTDRYRQYIPGNSRGYLPVKDSVVQFVVAVPGAEALVEDTISIESRRILKEKQTLKIQF